MLQSWPNAYVKSLKLWKNTCATCGCAYSLSAYERKHTDGDERTARVSGVPKRKRGRGKRGEVRDRVKNTDEEGRGEKELSEF